MAQLELAGADWSTGCASFTMGYRASSFDTLPVAVRCFLGASATFDTIALLDTGSQWSIVPASAMSMIDGAENLGLPTFTISSRAGQIDAQMYAITVTLWADSGQALTIEARCLVAEWERPVILGYSGLLEYVRIALDPGAHRDTPPVFWFGAAG
jgi:hypothetical protein